MKYIDTARQNIDQALGEWFSKESPHAIEAIHFQVGYFSIAGLRPLAPILKAVKSGTATINAAIGSNDLSTGAEDLKALVSLTGPLAIGSAISVVTFESGLFHPKVYALKRMNGTKAIYVGSSNLTGPALSGLNVEAGILLDDNDGDDTSSYNEIVSVIQQWSTCKLQGARSAATIPEIDKLLADGYLRQKSISQPGLSTSAKSNPPRSSGTVRRLPLKHWPRLKEESSTITMASTVPAASSINDTLVAEISGPGRWQQATFPKRTFPSFFGVPAGSGQTVTLEFTDGTRRALDTPAARTKSSANFTLELSDLNGVPYPSSGRPIAVFHRTAPRAFSYCISMPGQFGHTALINLLVSTYTGPSNQIMRIVTDLSTVRSWWPSVPLP